MLEILDSILATVAVILGISLIVQAIQQIIKQSFDLKSNYMRNELLALFNTYGKIDAEWANFKSTNKLAKQADEISKRIVNELENKANSFGFKDLHLIEHIDSASLKNILYTLPISKDKTVKDKFKEAIEDFDKWFDLSKKAFQEHYERRMKYWSFVISVALVLLFNANLLDIYIEFSSNKPLRDVAITMGNNFVAIPYDSLIVKLDTAKIYTEQKKDSIIYANIKNNVEQITNIVKDKSFQIMGWNKNRLEHYAKMNFFYLFFHLTIGWLSMILLVSLGAPFWYDSLKAIMGIKDKLKK